MAVDVRHPSGCRARTSWRITDVKERGDQHHDQTSEQEIVNREAVRQELWNKHLLNTALALAQSLRGVEVCEDAGSSTAGRSRT